MIIRNTTKFEKNGGSIQPQLIFSASWSEFVKRSFNFYHLKKENSVFCCDETATWFQLSYEYCMVNPKFLRLTGLTDYRDTNIKYIGVAVDKMYPFAHGKLIKTFVDYSLQDGPSFQPEMIIFRYKNQI